MALDNAAVTTSKEQLAETIRIALASDEFWETLRRFLNRRKRLQSLARRNRKKPMRVMQQLFNPKIHKHQVLPLLRVTSIMAQALSGKTDSLPPDAPKVLSKAFVSLVAEPPGRRRKQMYVEGLRMRQQGKTLHEICKILTSGYTEMSAPERRAARDRMDKGIGRARQFATQEGPTKSRK